MKFLIALAKLLASLFLAFVGFFVMAAVGWPEPLEQMTLERAVLGGAVMVVGLLCALLTILPKPRRKRSATRATAPMEAAASPEPDVSRPFWAEPAAEPEPPPEGFLHQPEAEVDPEPDDHHEPDLASEPEAAHHPAPAPDERASSPAAEPSAEQVQALLNKGDHLFGDGRLEDAQEPYDEALDMARRLARQDPSDEAQDRLASTLKAAGDVHDEMGRLDTAAGLYEEALTIRHTLAADQPDNSSRRRSLSLVMERLADTRDARGHSTRALDLYRQSLPIAEALAASAPGNVVYQEDLNATRRRLAELESRLTTPVI